jgi:hypothetical protein
MEEPGARSTSDAVTQVRSVLHSDAYLLVGGDTANLLGPDVLDVIAEQVLNLFAAGVVAGVQGRAEAWSGEAMDWLRRRLRVLLRRDNNDSIRPVEWGEDLDSELRELSDLDTDAVRSFAEVSEAITAAVLQQQGMTTRRAAAVAARARQSALKAVGAE